MEEKTFFFSYSRKDEEFALKLHTDLKNLGINVWIDKVDIDLGTKWDNEIEKALKGCSGIIFIVSSSSVTRDVVLDEISYGLGEGKRVLPVKIDECDVPFRFKRLHYQDFTKSYEIGLTKLIKSLKTDKKVVPVKYELQAQDIPKVNDEDALWNKVLKEDKVSAYQRYLKAHKGGKYASECMARIGIKYHDGLDVNQDYEKAIQWFNKAGNLGNALAMNYLAIMFQEGEGVEKDLSVAVTFYNRAAAVGNGDAMNMLGLLYCQGEGVIQDYELAAEWFNKAMKAGNLVAMVNLGDLYLDGRGVPKDQNKALKLHTKAAKLGCADGMNSIGYMYHKGEGVIKDMDLAIKWYTKAAHAGNVDAMYNLSDLYSDGEDVKRDRDKANDWRKKAEEANGFKPPKSFWSMLMDNFANS